MRKPPPHPFPSLANFNQANTTFVGSTKVYVVDEPTGVFVFNLLTAKECDEMVAVAEAHIASVGSDTSKVSAYTHTKCVMFPSNPPAELEEALHVSASQYPNAHHQRGLPSVRERIAKASGSERNTRIVGALNGRPSDFAL